MYSGVKGHEVYNLFSNGLDKTPKREMEERREGEKWGKVLQIGDKYKNSLHTFCNFSEMLKLFQNERFSKRSPCNQKQTK